MTKHTLTHEQVIVLSQKMIANKAQIEAKLAKGASMVDLAAIYKIPITSFKRIAKACGIELPLRESTRKASSLLFKDILVVLERVAKAGDIPYDEIKPYLQEGGE